MTSCVMSCVCVCARVFPTSPVETWSVTSHQTQNCLAPLYLKTKIKTTQTCSSLFQSFYSGFRMMLSRFRCRAYRRGEGKEREQKCSLETNFALGNAAAGTKHQSPAPLGSASRSQIPPSYGCKSRVNWTGVNGPDSTLPSRDLSAVSFQGFQGK